METKGSDEIDASELKRMIAVGQEQAEKGELIDGEAVFEEIRQLSARRRAAMNNSANERRG